MKINSFKTLLFLFIFAILIPKIYLFEKNGIDVLLQMTSKTPAEVQKSTVIDLIRRLLPSRVNEFQIQINSSLLMPDNKDKFIIESVETHIKITGTSGVAAANGFNYYLKYFAKCHISWSGDQLNVPSPLPVVKTPIHMTIQDKFRYYQNVCTASYSFVWWEWKRWEREIDWMALRGINFPLAFNGQEIIWRKVFQKIGLTKTEVDDYFSGPAFLAWNRMGNFQGWSGPLTEHWHVSQTQLQKLILKRMRDFGMFPILPAFSGHVPRNITRVYPHAKVSRLTNWGRMNNTYCCTSFLEPEDPLFITIGSAFIDEYKNEFGTDHFYNTDLFNEMIPKTKDVSYLSDCSKAVYKSIEKSDPQAIWVMQGWLFVNAGGFWKAPQAKALLTAVPQGKMIVLDLWSETRPIYQNLEGYYGQPFIWCMLHNFGGVLGLYGSFNTLNSERIFNARHNYTNMIGIGLTPEGIEQNDVVYDFMMEMVWNTSPVDMNKWIDNYTERRYGVVNKQLMEAWKILTKSVYIDPIKYENHGQYVYVRRPHLNAKSPLWYNPKDVMSAWVLFINALTDLKLRKIETLRYDYVDITRQVLQLTFDKVYDKLMASYKASNQTEFHINAKLILQILSDAEDVLASDKHFLLGKWIHSAKALANSDEERRFNEYDARNQITIWGPDGNHLDYATKQWSGIVSHYYKPRWELFINYLQKSLSNKTPFNQTAYNNDVFKNVECPFVKSNETFPIEAKGDTFEIVSSLHKKYETYIKDHFNTFSIQSYYNGEWRSHWMDEFERESRKF